MIGILRLGWSAVYVHRVPEGVVLVDAGPDYEGAWESACEQLARLGLRPDDVRHVLITHAHIDHAGLSWRWHELGARLWIGTRDRLALAAGAGGAASMRAMARAFLRMQGVPEDLSPGPFPTRTAGLKVGSANAEPSARKHGGDEGLRRGHYDHSAHWPAPLRWRAAGADAVLRDGEEVCGLRVVACPGHTPGSVVFYDEASRLLYTGDHLLPGMTPPPGLNFAAKTRVSSLPSWLASLQRLHQYDGAHVLPGHGEPFDGLGDALERNLAHVEQQARRLRRLLERGPATPYELLLRLYPHLPAGLLWFKLSEVIGQLDLLVEQAAVQTVAGVPGRYAVVS